MKHTEPVNYGELWNTLKGGPLPTAPVPHNGTQTSVEASRRTNAATDAARVLAALRANPATCDEIEARLDMRHQTASARINGLARDGLIEPCGKRATRTGCQAVVWRMKA